MLYVRLQRAAGTLKRLPPSREEEATMFEPLPSLIRLHREKEGLTIDALSALAGVSRTRLIALEKGNDNVSLDILVKIANALMISELQIGGLRLVAATPDVRQAVAAADAIHAARTVVEQCEKALEQAVTARAELDRGTDPVAALIASALAPKKRGHSSSEDDVRTKATGRGRA